MTNQTLFAGTGRKRASLDSIVFTDKVRTRDRAMNMATHTKTTSTL